ncbi:MAG TPA: aspartate aminotransferase family protein [Firmicutes bacterium]|nr:aspartate aminotransferase family protein [Bacillota bacterium]
MFEQLKAQDQQYIMNTYGRFDVAIKSGKGASCEDFDGKSFIDFGSGIGVNSLGYCHTAWVQAVTAQAGQLNHTSNLYYTKPCGDLAKKLCDLTGYQKVFFGNSGAEANEGAIKIARKYGIDHYGPSHTKIITLVNSFHGRTVTTLAATGQDVFHQSFFPLTEGFDYALAGDIEDVKTKVDENTAAILVEFIQGEGGVLPLEKTFVKQLETLCQEKDILLIADEVQTGVGRTGTFYCYEQYGVHPNLVTSAKGLGGGLPIGAILADEKTCKVFGAGDHGSTFGGNPIACAGANCVVDVVGQPEFLEQVRQKGAYLKEKLSKMPHVKDIRQMGLMIGFDLDTGTSAQVAAECVREGLLVLTAKQAVRLLPPLTITYEEIDKGLAVLEQVLKTIV